MGRPRKVELVLTELTYIMVGAAVALEGFGEPNRSEKGENAETSEVDALNGARTAAIVVRGDRLCDQAVSRQCKTEQCHMQSW